MDCYWLYVVLSFMLSLLSGFIITPHIVDFCLKRKLYDLPNERKVHKNAIPRLGGLAFLPCMFIAFLMSLYVFKCVTDDLPFNIGLWTGAFLVSLFIIYTVGVVDDIIGLGAPIKFAAQIIAASLLPICNLYINNLYGFMGIHEVPFWIGAPLTVFIIVFIDNAINLIDGIDGLAGGLSLIALTGFLVCFSREQIWTYCVLIAGLMGVLTAYLYFNIWGSAEKRRKLFMGDCGSLTLGFILGFLMVKFSMSSDWVKPFRSDSMLLAYTLLIVPCFDVVRVVLVRLRIHHPLFQADKRHFHHKLLRIGMSQHRALVAILILQLLYVLLNSMLNSVIGITYIVGIDIVIYMTVHLILDYKLKKIESIE